MRVRHGSFISRFGDKHTAGECVKGISEDVKEKITFSHKTNAERPGIFRFRRAAICTSAFKVQHAIKITGIKIVNVGFQYYFIVRSSCENTKNAAPDLRNLAVLSFTKYQTPTHQLTNLLSNKESHPFSGQLSL
jgi:hypothetical protein